ncbi:MAG: hypothetical protein FIA99_12305 [Ruminiclostridium sp.]|nr:hypothetical protein [Ruminiclostridium sp.]
MDNKLSLENITMLLLAIDKIRKASSPELRKADDLSFRPDKLSMIKDMMQIISGYLPETHRLSFNNALISCNRYCGAYCSLKNHLRGLKGQEPDVSHILSTFKAVMPMLEKKQTVPLHKAIAILEAIRN